MEAAAALNEEEHLMDVLKNVYAPDPAMNPSPTEYVLLLTAAAAVNPDTEPVFLDSYDLENGKGKKEIRKRIAEAKKAAADALEAMHSGDEKPMAKILVKAANGLARITGLPGTGRETEDIMLKKLSVMAYEKKFLALITNPHLKDDVKKSGLTKETFNVLKANAAFYDLEMARAKARLDLSGLHSPDTPAAKEDAKNMLTDIVLVSLIRKNYLPEKRTDEEPEKWDENNPEEIHVKPEENYQVRDFVRFMSDSENIDSLRNMIENQNAVSYQYNSILECDGMKDVHDILKDNDYEDDHLTGIVNKVYTKNSMDKLSKCRKDENLLSEYDNSRKVIVQTAEVFKSTKTMGVKQTLQMTMMEKALEAARKANVELAGNITDTKLIENYVKKLNTLQKAVSIYLLYKATNMNGRTAKKRKAAADKLNEFVREEIKRVSRNYCMLTEKKEHILFTDVASDYTAVSENLKALDEKPENRNIKEFYGYAETVINKMNSEMDKTYSEADPETQDKMCGNTAAVALMMLAGSNHNVWKSIRKNGYEKALADVKACIRTSGKMEKFGSYKNFFLADARDLKDDLAAEWQKKLLNEASAAENKKEKIKKVKEAQTVLVNSL